VALGQQINWMGLLSFNLRKTDESTQFTKLRNLNAIPTAETTLERTDVAKQLLRIKLRWVL